MAAAKVAERSAPAYPQEVDEASVHLVKEEAAQEPYLGTAAAS